MNYTFEDMVSAYIRGFLSSSWKWNGETEFDFEDPTDARAFFVDELLYELDNLHSWPEYFEKEADDEDYE